MLPNALSCQHGHLARSCDACFDAREIAELRALLGEVAEWANLSACLNGPECKCMTRRVQAALATRAEPVREAFEEWHKRECPYVKVGMADMVCGCFAPWPQGHGERFFLRTCREVYESEVPGASRTPPDSKSGEPAGRLSPAGGGAEPPPTGTNPEKELAEAAHLLEDGMTMGLGSEGRDAWYPTREDAARFRAALAKYREGRKG